MRAIQYFIIAAISLPLERYAISVPGQCGAAIHHEGAAVAYHISCAASRVDFTSGARSAAASSSSQPPRASFIRAAAGRLMTFPVDEVPRHASKAMSEPTSATMRRHCRHARRRRRAAMATQPTALTLSFCLASLAGLHAALIAKCLGLDRSIDSMQAHGRRILRCRHLRRRLSPPIKALSSFHRLLRLPPCTRD